ncbi:basic phospholipase A2 Cc2-PLA2 [Sitophilus oryzae]|uniref:Phospholipase A2 n=1 Tax=Sitophilus oryzae TaxID=7048 RepID=A0A6J2XYG8_SITOR|nr:basic phospholipase A2 Cc2-PLA2 [Sitophilus oryzae]
MWKIICLGYILIVISPKSYLQEYINNISSKQSNISSITTNSRFIKGYALKSPKIPHKTTPLVQESRAKRGVLHLFNMVSCATGCNPISYKGYGCFCGFLGSGQPVDGIDTCCMFHDWCYVRAKCPMYLEYFVPYYWKCHNDEPFCAIDYGSYGIPQSCSEKLCECDRILSRCLRQYPCPSKRAFCRSSPLRFIQNAFMLFS